MNSKKLVSAVLTATTVLWMVGAAALPLANAQTTTSSLQAQINALLAQISTLQSQLGTSGTTTTGTTSATTYNFTSDLTVGSTGAQVKALQQFLIAQGDLVLATPTTYFGAMTQKALAKFQAANGITPSVGYFGPKTRAFVNTLGTSTTTTTTTTTTLPAGCTTTSGFSTTTGASCATSSSLPAGCTTTTGFSPTTGVSCSTGTTSVVAPSTGLAISLASTNPAAGSLISSANSGSARVPVLAVNFTAGNAGAVTLSGVNFQKTGVLSDSAISGAYLTQNGQVVAQYNSLNSGLLSFSGLNLSIPAGQTVTLTLAVDISGGLSAGNTTGFALPAASDVTAFGSNNSAVTPAGSFPLNGNVFTVTSVTNPSLATVTVASSSIGTSQTAGTQGNIVGAWTFTVQNSPVYLQNLNFHVIGSANVANLQNVKLLVNGTQVGQTLTSVPANGMADFDDSASPVKLGTGSNNVQVVADIMGSPSDNFQFEILNGYDVLAVDSQYNVPVSITNNGGTGTEVIIQTGTITVSQDSSTPTGNIALGQSNVTLAKFDIYAAGEPVKVKYLDFSITLGGANGQALSNELQNVTITDDAGNQVGTSINQPPTSNACYNGTAGYVASTGVYKDCFGTSASPINYVVPANTTRVLSLKADIQNSASFSTITAGLTGDNGNLQGMTSSQTGNTSPTNGASLTLVSSVLTVAQNAGLGTQTVAVGSKGVKIGSYAFSASSAGGVNVNTVSVALNPSSTVSSAAQFSNLKVLVNGTQFGQTAGSVSNATTYSFSGSAFNIPAGQTVDVDVYADTLATAPINYVPATALVGYTGVGQVSLSSVTSNATVNGQSLNIGSGATLIMSADQSQAPTGQVVMGSTGNSLATFSFTETSNHEAANITAITVKDSATSTAFGKLYMDGVTAGPQTTVTTNSNNATASLSISAPTSTATTTGQSAVYLSINGSAQQVVFVPAGDTATAAAASIAASITSLQSTFHATATSSAANITLTSTLSGTTGNATTSASNVVTVYGVTGSQLAFTSSSASFAGGTNSVTTQSTNSEYYVFNFANPVVVPQGSSISLVLTGDAATYGSGGAIDNSTHSFSVTSVTAQGSTSNTTLAQPTGSASGNPQTVLRSILNFSSTPVGATSNRGKSTGDELADLSFQANAAGSIAVNTVRVTFSGTAASTTLLTAGAVQLIENNNSLATGTATTSNGNIVWTFNLGTTTAGQSVNPGATRTWKLIVNDNDLASAPSGSQGTVNLIAAINTNTDIVYTDGLDSSATSPLYLPSFPTPIQLNSVSFAQGI